MVLDKIDGVSFTVSVAPVTKKNHSRIVRRDNYSKLLPSKAYESYKKKALPILQFYYYQMERKTICCPINLKCIFYLPQRRKGDLVGYLQAIQDLLVEAGILEDDNRNIVASTDGSMVLYDKNKPRTEITITKKENYEQWKVKEKSR